MGTQNILIVVSERNESKTIKSII